MLKKLMLFLFLALSNLVYLNGQWVRQFSEAGSEYPRAIFATSDGSIFFAGYTEINNNNGYSWILKLSADGEKLGVNSYKIGWGTPNSKDEILDVYNDEDGFFIFAGNTEAYPQYVSVATKQMFLYKVTYEGDIVWTKVIGSELSSSFIDVYGTSDGGCLAAGYSYSLSTGSKDVTLVKLDSDGEVEWQRSYGGNGNDEPCDVYPTDDGGYIFAANSYSFYPFNGDFWLVKVKEWGDVEWEKTYGRYNEDKIYSFDITADGGYIMAGESLSGDPGNSDIWILKLSASGDILWQKAYKQGERSRADCVIALPEGGYAVVGTFKEQNRKEIVFFKLSEQGEIIWLKKISTSLPDEETFQDSACDLTQSADGGYGVLGLTETAQISDKYVLVIKVLSSGDMINCNYLKAGNLSEVDTKIVPIESSAENYVPIFIEYAVNAITSSTDFNMQILCPYKKNIIRR
ncbi:MAG: hypothetical protein JW755_09085 [Candidatus Aminicenantes bacterium]|nr:hypothetical protein [Candidatus Aminicenantes bacterium]